MSISSIHMSTGQRGEERSTDLKERLFTLLPLFGGCCGDLVMVFLPRGHEIANQEAVIAFVAPSLGVGDRWQPWNDIPVNFDMAWREVMPLRQ